MKNLQRLKQALETSCPGLFWIYRTTKRVLSNRLIPLEKKFSDIYQARGWQDPDSNSVSGPGSGWTQTELTRQLLPQLLAELKVRSILDAPCGDFYWMQKVILPVQQYIGIDIVPEIVTVNQQKFASQVVTFQVADITCNTLPQVDLILCRDCLIHLSYRHIFQVIANFKESQSRYLLTTTNILQTHNIDIISGSFRPLNLMMPPFNFPPPKQLIFDGPNELDCIASGRRLGLWELTQL
jgi:hypothetical protein